MSSERVEMVSCAAIVLITITHSARSWTINPQDTISDLNKRSSCTRSRVAKNTSVADWCSQSDMLEHVSSVTPATQTAPLSASPLHACLDTCAWSPGEAPSQQDVHINTRRASSLHALPRWLVWCTHQQAVCSICGTPESGQTWQESVHVYRSPWVTCMKVWWLAWLSSCHMVCNELLQLHMESF